MIPIVTHGSDQSAANPAMATVPEFVRHEFLLNQDGELEHFIAGKLRATVPPEGWESYGESWPDSLLVTKPAKGKKPAAK